MLKRHLLEQGQGMAQYALVIVLVAIAIIGSLFWLGASNARVYQRIVCALDFRRCPIAAHTGDTRCTVDEYIYVEQARCVGGRMQVRVWSTCNATRLSTTVSGATVFLSYNSASNRHEFSGTSAPACTVGQSVPITSNRLNGSTTMPSSLSLGS